MMPPALANAFFTSAAIYAAQPSHFGDTDGSNVVAVDFKRKTVREPVSPMQLGLPEKAEWKDVTTARLSALHRLEAGWDGKGSEGPSAAVLSRAQRILDVALSDSLYHAPPAVVPCADGSLQLEWWLVDTRFELVVEPNGHLEGWALDRKSGREVAADGFAAVELLAKWSARLTADKLIKPV